jgi:hypothetical protein
MAVVFDEVVAEVEPDAARSGSAGGATEEGGHEDPLALGRELRRRAVRAERLRAD